MIVRRMSPSDIRILSRIHEKFYAGEFSFGDLFGNSLSSLVVTDDDDKIICGGQTRTIAEACIVTNKDIKISERRRALMSILNHFRQGVGCKGFDQLHAFVQDENWRRHLIKAGFKPTKGEALVIGVG